MKRIIRTVIGPAFVLMLIAAWVCGCGGAKGSRTNLTTPSGPSRAATYVTDQGCKQCHPQVAENEFHTAHKEALETLKAANQQNNTRCLGCHTTGFNDGGFVNEQSTPQLAGVQCESCHGKGSEHVAGHGDPTKIVRSVSADVCTKCHSGSHHPFAAEWEQSAHKNALDARRGMSYFKDSCLECHSTDYEAAPAGSKPTKATAQFGITCVGCHDPHSAVNEGQLKHPKEEICSECHNAEGAVAGQAVHHPHEEMVSGIGGYGGGQSSAHRTVEGKCVKCHMYTKPYESEANPAIVGHTWHASAKACDPCHTESEATNLITTKQANTTARLAAVKARLDAATGNAAITSTDAFKEAKFNYDFVNADGSLGVHNPRYAESLLDAAELRLTGLGL